MTSEAKVGNIGSAFDNNFKNWVRKYFKTCIQVETSPNRFKAYQSVREAQLATHADSRKMKFDPTQPSRVANLQNFNKNFKNNRFQKHLCFVKGGFISESIFNLVLSSTSNWIFDQFKFMFSMKSTKIG